MEYKTGCPDNEKLRLLVFKLSTNEKNDKKKGNMGTFGMNSSIDEEEELKMEEEQNESDSQQNDDMNQSDKKVAFAMQEETLGGEDPNH